MINLFDACRSLKNMLPKLLIIWLTNLLILRIPNEGYSRNALCTKFDIYVFITITGSIPLLVDY